ncbi:MAG: 4Fe-4S dicluster domain-containing protein [Planctomycetota bacterium]
MNAQFLPHDRIQGLIDILLERGYLVLGPQVRENAVVLAPLEQASQLPWGVVDQQSPGSYSLESGDESRAFGWVNGPSSLKPFLFKQQETLWQSTVNDESRLQFESVVEAPPQAVIGLRPCDVEAMRIQDRVFLGGEKIDIRYEKRRETLFSVVVNCTRAADTCFCVSMGGNPEVKQNFDLAMTEIDGGLLANSGSVTGEEVLRALSLGPATESQQRTAQAGVLEAATSQRRRVPPPERMAELLPESRDHPHWDAVAERCESCGTCTNVCPTCICHKQTYLPSLDGEGGEQVREWASCQGEAHSYLAGKTLRAERRERYRMWLTHKFGNWSGQFATPGCVGCGRCISWCTNGIDHADNLRTIIGESSDG